MTGLQSVDFASPDAVRKGSVWASEKTEGLLPVVSERFDPATRAAVANAMYSWTAGTASLTQTRRAMEWWGHERGIHDADDGRAAVLRG